MNLTSEPFIVDQTSTVQAVNKAIKASIEGTTLLYGIVTEKSHQDAVVNTVGAEIVKIDDEYDNIFFHRITGSPTYEKLRFGYRKITTLELCCYVENPCTFEVLEAIFITMQMGGGLLELKGNNQNALDVLKRCFLIDDPTKNIGFNQEKYIFSFIYEVYTYVAEICYDPVTCL
jgi:hypothetical protein